MQHNSSARTLTSKTSKFASNLLLTACIFAVTELPALPVFDNVSKGEASLVKSADAAALQINQASDKAILNWQSFNISKQESVHFQQPANAVCLNRINAANGMSHIDGILNATGKIYLINQAGVLFGETAKINVGGIIASAIDIKDQSFLENKQIFDQASKKSGAIINKGTINVAENGLAILLGKSVKNDGVINARLGTVTLAVGNKFTLDFYGDQLINFTVDVPASSAGHDEQGKKLTDAIAVQGKIFNEAGAVVITGQAAQNVFDNLINMSGEIQAQSITQAKGVINLLGDETGTIKVAGTIDAQGVLDGTNGGKVLVSSANLELDAGATINVSGQAQGGQIYLSDLAEYGVEGLPIVKNIFVAPHAKLHADSLQYGNGGEIVSWSDVETTFLGTATARGGALGGNGGFIEMSTHGRWLQDEKHTHFDTSAVRGQTGTFSLDPKFLIVQTSGGNPYVNNLNNLYNNNAAGTTILTPSSINSAAQLSNVRLQANSDIIFVDPLAIIYSGKTLTVSAGRSVLLNANVSTTNGAITITANDNTALSANRATVATGNPTGDTETVNGNIIMATGTSISSGTAALNMTVGTSTTSPFSPGSITTQSVTGGAITLSTPNALTANGNIAAGSSLSVSVGTASTVAGVISGAGTLTKNGAGVLTLNAANTFTGATVVNAGILRAGVNNVIANSASISLANTSGVAFELNGFNQSVNTLFGGGVSGGNIVLGGGNLTVTQGTNNNFSGVISGNGNLVKEGAATLTLIGNNTYNGNTVINAGVLRTNTSNALPNNTHVMLANVSTAKLNLANTNQTIGSLSGGGATGGAIILGSGTLTIQQASNQTYAAEISGTGGVTLNGTAALTLSGTNIYTGTTTITAGTLRAGANNTLANTPVVIGATATLDLDSYSQQIGTLAGSGQISLGSATLTVTQGTLNTYSGVISGTGNLVKNGSSTLILSGANTFTGTTTVNAGKLQAGATNALASSLVLADTTGVVFDLDGYNQSIANLSGGGTLGGNITLGSGNLSIAQSAANSYAGIISGTGNLIKNGSSTLTLNGINTYSGTTSINAGILQTGVANALATSSGIIFSNSAGAELDANSITQSINNISGGGALGGNITLGTATLTVNQSAANTYAGVITGTGSVALNGAAVLTLTGANTYTGATTINSGTLRAGAVNVLAASSPVIIANTAGATFDLNNYDQTIGSLSGGGLLGGDITLGTARLTVNQTSNQTYAGIISGSGGVTKESSAALTFTGNNSYTGSTIVNDGILRAGALNTFAPNSAVTLADVATAQLDLNNHNQTIGSLSGGGAIGGNILLGSGVLLVNQTAPGTYAGLISGTGNLVVALGSTNTLTLAGNNTYSGTTSVRAGKLKINSDTNLGTAPVSPVANYLNLNGGVLEVANTFTLDTNRGITLGASNGNIEVAPASVLTYNGVVAGSGSLTKAGSGTLILGGTNTYTGETFVTGGMLQANTVNIIAATSSLNMSNVADASFDLNDYDQTIGGLAGGGVTGGNVSLGAANLTVQQVSPDTYSGVISGTGGLVKNGAGTLILGGANTYIGPTTVNSGTLRAGDTNVISSSSQLVMADVSGAMFDLNSYDQEVGNLSGGGIVGGNILLGSGTLTVRQDVSNDYSGIISGTGGLHLDGTDVLVLNGANTYSGTTAITAGTLRAGANNVISNLSNIELADNATAVFDLNDFDQSVGNLSGGGATGGNVMLGQATLTVNQTSNTAYSGVISDFAGGNVVLNGSAALTLAGDNTYSGTTTINSGVLRAGAADVIADSSELILANAVGAEFDLNNFNQTVGSISGGGGSGGNISLGTAALTVEQNVDNTYSGIISGTGPVIKTGPAVLTLGNVNTYTGATTIEMGRLQAGAVNTISSSVPISIAGAAVFDLNGYNQSVDTLVGTSGMGTNVILNSATLDVINATDLVIQP